MTVRIEELNASNCKTYLLTVGEQAVLVDPVRERQEAYRRTIAERALRLRMIVETHTHADHFMLGRAARKELAAPTLMHRDSPSPLVDRHVDDGEVLMLGDRRIEVIHTPGHTPDSICLLTGGGVLTGDTLLIGGSGRTDFPGGDPGKQYDAVIQRLFTLPEDTVLWPAHDYQGRTSSTIGVEKRGNSRFAGRSREDYVRLMKTLDLPLPERIQEALQANQSGLEGDELLFPAFASVATVAECSPLGVARALREPSPPLVIDVREPEEFVGDLGHIGGALLVPMDCLARRLPKLAGYAGREVVVVCRAGARSASAAAMLRQAGFRSVANLSGGMLAWCGARLPVQR